MRCSSAGGPRTRSFRRRFWRAFRSSAPCRRRRASRSISPAKQGSRSSASCAARASISTPTPIGSFERRPSDAVILRAICLALVALTAAGVVSGPPGPSALRRLAFVTLSSATQSPQPGLSKNDRDIVLTILRQVQDDVKKHYYDPAFHGIDLKARFAEAESRLQTVASFNEAMAILTASLTQLDDSHTALYPPNRATHADYGWRMAIVGNQVLVVDVTDGSDAAAQGVAPGDQVLSLNRFVPTRD